MIDSADVFLDTSVLLYAALGSNDTPAHFEKARSIILEENFAVSASVLSEFYEVATVRGEKPLCRQSASEWIEKLALKPCRSLDVNLVKEGTALADEFDTSLRNALVILSARRLGCVKIYSERMAGVSVPDIEIINPFK
tara:strand:- start:6144 stop:6560 length:417 start_codon:yes stop_codon:yes gene_type:complete